MADIRQPRPGKLICSLIYSDESAYTGALTELKTTYGQTDFETQQAPFTHTAYYGEEMGNRLKRRFVSFEKPVTPDALAPAKALTIEIEKKYLNENGGRIINIDPGFLCQAKLVLASAKNFSHRVYMSQGIYGESTLRFNTDTKSYEPWPWTYPDYTQAEIIGVFNKIRGILTEQAYKSGEKKR
ncbi:MAG: DUF4416 domain-containing protein [Candidatus Goldiibacteriota bacterium HGW-Goldbacteria-1]|jgi:hypothetical protein|nr:MAG: DUF4416 domain-containing protein [Candidatus Goldiibacteriota bacterium HGW-Goldbacteria-1]